MCTTGPSALLIIILLTVVRDAIIVIIVILRIIYPVHIRVIVTFISES